jgi:hypothetical protein
MITFNHFYFLKLFESQCECHVEYLITDDMLQNHVLLPEFLKI